ncbi:helix-turn-helix domain-containing protein [Kordiimonas lacus]|uniref:Helix-turn-helix domain-containing protein n=1 Tax=Kordiimonas lacus TaxID=637679 RepID=A0A1G6VUY8_9PROT|nr:helix-turn-helix transcriptional regulator [Kordiimonas lacus]SDD56635.1 Helix-turn-helix domain-containing protein [Kordiimonas lacus]
MQKQTEARLEFIPQEYADRLLDGENPIRVFRELRNLSVENVAMLTGLSVQQIASLEEMDLAALPKIAQALQVDLEDLI